MLNQQKKMKMKSQKFLVKIMKCYKKIEKANIVPEQQNTGLRKILPFGLTKRWLIFTLYIIEIGRAHV
jgi:hypothetical protein